MMSSSICWLEASGRGKTHMCVMGLKYPRIEVTVHQFGPLYSTEIIAMVLCMYANYVIWGGVSCVCVLRMYHTVS